MSTADRESIRVLHVDDEPDFAELAATFLEREREEFETVTATSGAEGLAFLADAEIAIDCVVSDYDMPGLNGLDFLEAVREEHPELPFVLFTGRGSEEIASEAITAGVTDYLNKGSGTSQYRVLANRIQNAVAARRAERRSAEQAQVIEVIRGVTQAVVRASTRAGIEQAVCDRLTDAESYSFAWVGDLDRETNAADPSVETGTEPLETRADGDSTNGESADVLTDGKSANAGLPTDEAIVPRAFSGTDKDFLDSITGTVDERLTTAGPVGKALRTADVHLVGDTRSDPSVEVRAADEPYPYRSMAAIPLCFEKRIYGMVAVYADRPDAFDDTWEVLSELGETIGHAIHAAETRKRLRGQYHELFAQAPVMYATTRNRDGAPIIEDCNERFCETLGYPRESVLGRPLADLYTTQSAAALLEGGGYERALEAEFISEERGFVARDGSVVETLLRAVPRVDDEGDVVGTLTLFVDVTERRRAETVVAQASALDTAIDGMALLDADGEYTYVNEAHAEIYGYDSPAAFAGEHWGLCYTDEEFDFFEREVMPALERDGQWRGEATGTRRDGTSFPQELSLTALDDGGSVCVVRDVTERNERRRELEAQRQKIEALHAVTTDLVSCRAEIDVYELTVDAAERILELDMCNVGVVEGEMVVPKAWSADMDPEHTRPMGTDEGMVGKTFQTGTSYLIDDLSGVTEAKPTEEGYRSAISVPIGDFGVFQAVSMEAGEFDETDLELAETFVATVVATIERIEREAQLRDREAQLNAERDRFETLFEYIPDPAVTVSLREGEAITRSVNVAFEDVFGYAAETIVGEPINDFIVPPDGIGQARAIDRTAMEDDQVIEEVRRRTADGDVRDFLFRNVPIEGNTETEAFGIYTDITDRREYERTLERQNERLEEFASVVSHDLRNPLGVAQGYLALLEVDDEEILGKIHNAHDRMERIVEDVLTLARQGKAVGDTEPVELSATVETAWQNVDTREAQLLWNADDGGDAIVDADAGRLCELFENLFRNAIEHGGDDVTIRVERFEGGFAITDDGPGIPAEKREQVFEHGFSTGESGTGFGLSIVRTITEAHGWAVTVTDGESGGARFEIRV